MKWPFRIHEQPEKSPEEEKWRREAMRIWYGMTPVARQGALIDVVPHTRLSDITKYPLADFSELPEEYIRGMAKKWGLLGKE